jgi:hypothetical protein
MELVLRLSNEVFWAFVGNGFRGLAASFSIV